jgi:histidinol-phosphatase (PHP family)
MTSDQQPILLYESHMHTPLCNHARGQPEEYAAVAQVKGLAGIIVTCHNPLPEGLSANVRMTPDQFEDYLALVRRAHDAWQGRIDVRLGLECDYLPGLEDWLTRQTASAPFDFILGSIHPQLREYRDRYWRGDPAAFQRQYFHHLADAAETELFDSLSHPDLVKNEFHGDWHPLDIMDSITRALDRIAATGVAMELNTSGLNKAIPEMNPAPLILREMAARKIPVTVGSDAHDPHRVAADWPKAFDLLRQAGYKSFSFFMNRTRRDIPLDSRACQLIGAIK